MNTMKKLLKFGLAALIFFSSLNAASTPLPADVTAIQKLRAVCGTYFGATLPTKDLTASSITDDQIKTKLTAAPADFATTGQITMLLNNALTFFSGITTYTDEISAFQGRITAQSGQSHADTMMTTLRNKFGSYFGTATPATLAAIPNDQITAKLTATDFATTITSGLTSAQTTFANYPTYLSEVTTFQAQIKALQDAYANSQSIASDVNAIATMSVADLSTKIGTLTTTTDVQILTAVVNRIKILFSDRATNATKDSLTSLISMLKTAQAKFTTDTSYTGMALIAALEETEFETDKIGTLNTVLSNADYLSFAKANRPK